MTKKPLGARGPWLFSSPALSSGDEWVLDLRNRKHNGQKGYFRQFMPLDSLQVTNEDGSNAIQVSINGTHDARVVPAAVESYDDAGVTHLKITNDGGSSISKGDVTIELASPAYDADDRARERKARPTVEKIVSGITGIEL